MLASCFLLLSLTSCDISSLFPPASSEENSQISAGEESQNPEPEPPPITVTPLLGDGEMKGIWLSYLDLIPMIQGKTLEECEANLDLAFSNISSMGLTDVFVQVRPFSDALYLSDNVPVSHILTGEQGAATAIDPLEIMARLALEHGLRLHAWINPYRVKEGAQPPELAPDSIAGTWFDEKSDNIVEVKTNEKTGLYLNPGKEEVRSLILRDVLELVEKYDISGIHLDDYFYPVTDASFDKAAYAAAETELDLADWRREQVNILVLSLNEGIKAINPDIVFGISVASDVEKNRDVFYADIDRWLISADFIDYLIPQIYHGFMHETYDFYTVLNRWSALPRSARVYLYVGLSAYKIGVEDKFAGTGSAEWLADTKILARQVETTRLNTAYNGFVLYRYDSLFNPSDELREQVLKEIEDLSAII